MRILRSLLFLVSGGFALASAWFVAALLCTPLRATRPLAGSCFHLARFCLWHDDGQIVRERQVARYQTYLRTGHLSDYGEPRTWSPETALIVLLWAPIGGLLALGHLLHAVFMAAPFLTDPWGSRNRALVRAALFPLGVAVLPTEQALAVRFAGPSRRPPPSARLFAIGSHLAATGRRAVKPVARASGAGLILWASSSANEAHLHSPTPPFDVRQPFGVRPPFYPSSLPEASERDWARLEAGPPLPVQAAPTRSAPLKTSGDDCTLPKLRDAGVAQLSRGQIEFGALPLGSRQLRIRESVSARAPERMQRVQDWVGPARRAKAAGGLCLGAARDRIARGTAFAAKSALADRLARKAPSELRVVAAGGPLTHFGAQGGHAVTPRHLAGLLQWTGAVLYAKADEHPTSELAAEKVANTVSLAAAGAEARQAAARAVRVALKEVSAHKVARWSGPDRTEAARTAPNPPTT